MPMVLTRLQRSAFQTYFPTPKFLRMPAHGIDFSYRSVRVVELVRTHYGAHIGRHAEKKIPDGVAYSNQFSHDETVKRALLDLKKIFRLKFVSVSVPEEKGYLFTTLVPALSDSQIRANIELQLEENVPIAPADAIFDYTVIARDDGRVEGREKNSERANDMLTVSVAVYPREILENTTALFASVGLIIESFHLGADAIAASLMPDGARGAHILLNLGEKNTGISVVSDRVLQFTSMVSFGAEAFTSAIERQFQVSRDEAIAMKQSADRLNSKEAMQILFSVANPASVLKDEIAKVIAFWETHSGHRNIDKVEKVLLCGTDAAIPGLADYLSLGVGVPVEMGNVWTNLFSFENHIPSIPLRASLSYASAIGLARKCLEM